MSQEIEMLRPLGRRFQEQAWPRILCRYCLSPMRPGKIQGVESIYSRVRGAKSEKYENWDPTWIEGTFSCQLTCPECGDVRFVTGDMQYDEVVKDNEGSVDYKPFYTIKFIRPCLEIMSLPLTIRKSLVETIWGASDVLFANPDAAANRLRVAIDELLTSLKVRRTTVNKKHKKVKLETHQRIDIFRKKNAEAADYLEAVKWIGNDGSHEKGLTVDDVLNGAELLEHALFKIYDKGSEKLATRMRKINARKTIKEKVRPEF